MLVPKKLRYRKPHRGRMRGQARGGTEVQFGEYGLQALEPSWITNRQIEAARIAMTRKIKRGGTVWINIFPHKPVTKKPAETRMGSGKGSPEGYVAVVKPGRVMFEMSGVNEELERRLAATRRELFNLRFQHATGQLENTGQLKEVRKNIARLLTVLNQKQRENEYCQRRERKQRPQGPPISEGLIPAPPKGRRWIRTRVRCRATPRVAVARSG